MSQVPPSKSIEVYGVLPYIAPEIIRGRPCTPASDIYSFSMIMWEFTSGDLPFDNRNHDVELMIEICKGERHEIIENTPQCYIDLMKKCWDEDPLKRPTALEILNIIENWYIHMESDNISNEDISDELKDNIIKFQKADEQATNYKPKPIEKYHSNPSSRLLNFTAELNEVLDQGSEQSINLRYEFLYKIN